MLACAAYELDYSMRIATLRKFLQEHPDTPHANRVQSLIASAYFYEEDYEAALEAFAGTRPELLDKDECDDMTYRLAVCHLQTGNLQEAAIWFETLRSVSSRYAGDCVYYISYIRYTQRRNDEALEGFLSLQGNSKYARLVPYYIAEVYLAKNQPDKAEAVAERFLSAYPGDERAAEMYRVLGTAQYRFGKYREAMDSFGRYFDDADGGRRDAYYMLGMSCYECGAYGRAVASLAEATGENDALAQNAYLHMGLSYLQLADKTNARMAFEQAAASDADPELKEQAAYNYALCIHDTSYSAFGESVNVFERFLNDYPQSPYADKVSDYLIDVYMSTRSYEAALNSIERIKQPTAPILMAKGRILFQLGIQAFANTDFEEAADYFRNAERLAATLGTGGNELRGNALYWEGETQYRLGNMQRAAACFDSYLSAHADDKAGMAHYNLGYIAFHRQDYISAGSHFAGYIRLQRDGTEDKTVLADAYNRLGDCNMNVRRFDEARRYYAAAGQLGTSVGDYSYYQLALVAGVQKDYNGKVALLDSLALMYPSSPYNIDALYEKGRSYVQENNSAQAVVTFRELLDKYPESPLSRKAAAEIGLIYYRDNHYDRAIEVYRYVATQYPGSEEARLALRDLKSIYVETNRVDEFAELVGQIPGGTSFEPSEQDSLTYIAAEKVYIRGDIDTAKSSFVRYLQSYPDGAFMLNAHYYLALIADKQQDGDGVLEHSGRLLEYPDNPYSEEASLLHGVVLFNRQQYAEAMTDYKRLHAKAATASRRQTGALGVLRCAALLGDHVETINAATALLSESNLSPELQNEAFYYRAKAYLAQNVPQKAGEDLAKIAGDTRTRYGAEAKYLLAQQLYDAGDYAGAEKEVLDFIEQSTPHAYWLARSFVLLSDVYVAMDKKLDARQYLLSLQQNYREDDDIQLMILERLERLK